MWRIALFGLIAAPILPALDKVRIETHVDDAIAKYQLTGKGVIFAMLDRGIDWQNNDFRNDDGTTRIAYIFDLTDNTGATAPGNPYKVGTIYSRPQINQALQQGTILPTRDAIGHGTANTAVAAGNGRNSTDRKYRGIAPSATIIAVKIGSESASAHDGQPAEAAFYKPELIPVAIDFVRDKKVELGLPCVMLLDLGSQGGPTDGTSSLARKIDGVVGTIPGLIVVTGTGDDGGVANRAHGSVQQGQSATIQIQKGTSNTLYFDFWYSGSNLLDVLVQTPAATYGPYRAPTGADGYDIQQTADFYYAQLAPGSDYFQSTSGKREIYITFTGPPGKYGVTLIGRSVHAGHFDATINPSQE